MLEHEVCTGYLLTLCLQENLAVILENLRALKAKHATLCSQVKDIAAAQKQSMDSIRNRLGSVMNLIQNFQQTTEVEVPTQYTHCSNTTLSTHIVYRRESSGN